MLLYNTDYMGLKGRAGLIALRKSRGQVAGLGKAYFKGGFEPRMNRREASLILHLKWDYTPFKVVDFGSALLISRIASEC